jgi:hypothetical protein
MTATRTRSEIKAEIGNLLKIEVHIQTNQGTYGNAEACRKVGNGSSEFANREVYETVGGTRRETGPSEDNAPGTMRSINRQRLADLRSQVAELKQELKRAKS